MLTFLLIVFINYFRRTILRKASFSELDKKKKVIISEKIIYCLYFIIISLLSILTFSIIAIYLYAYDNYFYNIISDIIALAAPILIWVYLLKYFDIFKNKKFLYQIFIRKRNKMTILIIIVILLSFLFAFFSLPRIEIVSSNVIEIDVKDWNSPWSSTTVQDKIKTDYVIHTSIINWIPIKIENINVANVFGDVSSCGLSYLNNTTCEKIGNEFLFKGNNTFSNYNLTIYEFSNEYKTNVSTLNIKLDKEYSKISINNSYKTKSITRAVAGTFSNSCNVTVQRVTCGRNRQDFSNPESGKGYDVQSKPWNDCSYMFTFNGGVINFVRIELPPQTDFSLESFLKC